MRKPESLKEALEFCIEMWRYMYENDEMDKAEALRELNIENTFFYDCCLCNFLAYPNGVLSSSKCSKCIQWGKKTRGVSWVFCEDNRESVYSDFKIESTKENAKKVLDHLKSEHKRLFLVEEKIQFISNPSGSTSWWEESSEILTRVLDSFSREHLPTYLFSTDSPNWNLLCADLFEDNIPLAFITSGERHYVAGILNPVFGWGNIFDRFFIDYVLPWEELPYDILEVNSPEECKKLVKKFTERYREYHKGLRRKACNRARKLKKTKTWGVYSY